MWDTPRFWLLPWIAVMAIVAAIPLVVWPERGRRSMFSPISYAAWFHIVPSFVVGGLVLVAGFTPWFFHLVPNPERTLPWAMSLLAAGFLGLYAGFALPWGARLGARVSRLLPDPYWTARDLAPVSVVAMATAIAINAVAFRVGWIGMPVPIEPTAFSAAGVFAAWTSAVTATVLLLLVLLWPGGVAVPWRWATALALLSWIVTDTLSSGRRGALLQFVVLGIGAWSLAGGPRLNLRRSAIIATLTATTVIAGMLYGTTFRHVLAEEPPVASGTYAGAVAETFRRVGSRSLVENAVFSVHALAERLEIVSSVALIVGNYERLKPFEAAFGLEDNIRVSLLTALVPRAVWPDKPPVSDSWALGELYFGYRNSYAVTPIGDLVRNFGPWSVPAGMALLGLLLRIGYAALVEDRPPSIMRAAAYIVLVTSVSYEGFYGAIVPGLIRTIGVLAVLLLGVHLGVRAVAGLRRQRS